MVHTYLAFFFFSKRGYRPSLSSSLKERVVLSIFHECNEYMSTILGFLMWILWRCPCSPRALCSSSYPLPSQTWEKVYLLPIYISSFMIFFKWLRFLALHIMCDSLQRWCYILYIKGRIYSFQEMIKDFENVAFTLEKWHSLSILTWLTNYREKIGKTSVFVW